MKTMMTLAAALAASTASAQITSEDDAIFGVDSITRDASQQLDFLDLTITLDISIPQAQSLLQSDSSYQDFRFATVDEIFTLAVNGGFADSFNQLGTVDLNSNASVNSIPDPAINFFDTVGALGVTDGGGALIVAAGLTIDPTVTANGGVARIGFRSTRIGPGQDSDRIDYNTSISPSLTGGIWLVRVVPAPSTAALLGVAGLAATRRRR